MVDVRKLSDGWIDEKFSRLRGLLTGTTLGSCGKRLIIRKNVRFAGRSKIKIGNNVHLFNGAVLDAKVGMADDVYILLNSRVMVREYALVMAHRGRVEIGPSTFIGPHCLLQGPNLVVGEKVMIASGVKIYSSSHDYNRLLMEERPWRETSKGVRIADRVWIGANATIMDGVTVGLGAMVAAGAVVIRNVPERTVVAGVPARVMKTIEQRQA